MRILINWADDYDLMSSCKMDSETFCAVTNRKLAVEPNIEARLARAFQY